MTTRDHERLDRIIERYSARMPDWMARFVEWVRKPQLRVPRIVAGVLLVLFGFVGFLPVLGFWMVPVGLLVLSQDLNFVRRGRRRVTLWWDLLDRAQVARLAPQAQFLILTCWLPDTCRSRGCGPTTPGPNCAPP